MPIVLIPGFSLTSAMWDAVDIEGTAVDVPVAEDWSATVSAIAGAGPGTYCGYSMGGRLALGVALEYPDLVEHLVLISSSPGLSEADRALRRESDERRAVFAEISPARFYDDWLAQPILAGASWRNRISSGAQVAHQLRVLGQGAMPSYWERLGELSMPVTLVVGADDHKYVAIANRMVESIENCRIEVVGEAGHPLVAQRPEEIARILSATQA